MSNALKKQTTTIQFADRQRSELLLLLAALLAVHIFGTLGYMWIEGWNEIDAIYMTIITVATIGFGEVHPLSQNGRIFTIVLIVLGTGVVATAFATFTRMVVDHEFKFLFGTKRMNTIISKLRGHTIICGFGRLSSIAASEIIAAGGQVVVIEKEETRATECELAGFLVVRGDTTDDDTLVAAGIKYAHSIAALLPKSSDNLYVVLTARDLNPSIFILSRAEDDQSEKKLRRAGADKVIAPYRIGGKKIADGLMRPYVTDFLDIATSREDKSLSIEEFTVPDNSPFVGKSIGEAKLKELDGALLAALVRSDGTPIVNPGPNERIDSKTTFIVLGEPTQIRDFERLIVGVSNAE